MIKEFMSSLTIVAIISAIVSIVSAISSAYSAYLARMVFLQKEKMNLYNTLNDFYDMLKDLDVENIILETEHNGIKYKDIKANLQMSKLCCSKEIAKHIDNLIEKYIRIIAGNYSRIISPPEFSKETDDNILGSKTIAGCQEELDELIKEIKNLKEKLEQESYLLTEKGLVVRFRYWVVQMVEPIYQRFLMRFNRFFKK